MSKHVFELSLVQDDASSIRALEWGKDKTMCNAIDSE